MEDASCRAIRTIFCPALDQRTIRREPMARSFIAVAIAIVAGLFSPRLAVDAHEYPVGAVAFMRSTDSTAISWMSSAGASI